MNARIRFRLNYETVEIEAPPMKRLLDILREDFNITGTKEGCGEGECGACSVLIDGMLKNSCIYPAGMLEGRDVITIEGLRRTKAFEVLKECFEEAGAVQCGFCTPGMIMASFALLSKNSHPSDSDIREGISGNLCRCTGYGMIIEAVKKASERGEGLWKVY